MKNLFLITLLFSGSLALAEAKTANSVSAELGFNAGGAEFGANYEYMFNGSQSVGGALLFSQKDTTHGQNGYVVLGGLTGFHFFKGDWDLSLAPSLNIINISSVNPNKSSTTTLGPGLSISLTTALNDKVALGFDYLNYWVWFSDDYRGLRLSDLLVKVKIGF